jgi:MarR family transcriptional regulator, organic hydroperoxide resistance regulator
MVKRLETVRDFWTRVLGIRGPQWMIMVALQRLDQGQGACGQAIAEMLCVNQSFVTTQARFLEKKGLVRRKALGEGDGAVMLWLTEKARQHLAEISHEQDLSSRIDQAENAIERSDSASRTAVPPSNETLLLI